MFKLIWFLGCIGILVYVGFTAVNVKNRFVNHEENPFQAPSVSSVASSTFGGIKDLMASRQSVSGNGCGFFSGVGISGNNSKDNYRGGYLKSRPDAVGKSTQQMACDFYPDQCKKETNRVTPKD